VLLDQNFYADMQTRYIDKVPSHCQLLLGPRYALLREEFRLKREGIKPRMGEVKRVLVFFGGVDAVNYTCLAIQALFECNRLIQVDVVIGAKHPCQKQVQNACNAFGYTLHVETTCMAELMAKADLAIGAGGTSTWERCCLGLPAICLCLADNQRKQIADATEAGLSYTVLGELDLVEKIRKQVLELLGNPSSIKSSSRLSIEAVDGRGVIRISRMLHGMMSDTIDIVLRMANSEDAIKIWPWRNHEDTRRYSFDNAEVTIDEHIQWWSQSLLDQKRILLLGSFMGVDFGVIRFDFEGSSKVVTSIYLNPSMTGKGLGRALLISGIHWLGKSHPNIKSVVADILPQNLASVGLFKSAGFQEGHTVFRMELAIHDR